ncbi:unnamed protein product [Rotaria magnacalcarata]|uniref:Uncharacterized protein n=1 Tax=Rotaria magnacalcarata TaxID=392030 RepID=A0A815J946_9BILA|nr:unnamed protein product [Rotaria magnacalcarata]CAF1682784.1 unnamed protein product [Rotaria magnacalcarata]CAF4146348.1 unnamed protein product [Rotaria magnacalcarata]CAF4217465.1 unnamed protein product [Rotaria magnacalcarata]
MSFARCQHTALYIRADNSVCIIGDVNSNDLPVKRMEKFFLDCNCFKEFGSQDFVRKTDSAALIRQDNICLVTETPTTIGLLNSINGTVSNLLSFNMTTGKTYSWSLTFLSSSGRVLLIGKSILQYYLFDPLSFKISLIIETMSTVQSGYAVSFIPIVNRLLVTGVQNPRILGFSALITDKADLYDDATNRLLPLKLQMQMPRV